MAYFQSEDGFRCLDRAILLYIYAIICIGHGDHKLDDKNELYQLKQTFANLTCLLVKVQALQKIVWSTQGNGNN